MRAIVEVEADLSVDEFKDVVREIGWWPSSDRAEAEAETIIETVAAEHREHVRATYRFPIFDARNRSWGIVCEETDGSSWVARIRNPEPRPLQDSCERLVRDLRDYSQRHRARVEVSFKFPADVTVFQQSSYHTAFFGEVLEDSGWIRIAVRERPAEALVGLVAFVLFIALAASIYPSIDGWLGSGKPNEFGAFAYWNGMIGRLATSLLVTTFVSWVTVALHGNSVRRDLPIRWYLEARRPRLG